MFNVKWAYGCPSSKAVRAQFEYASQNIWSVTTENENFKMCHATLRALVCKNQTISKLRGKGENLISFLF